MTISLPLLPVITQRLQHLIFRYVTFVGGKIQVSLWYVFALNF